MDRSQDEELLSAAQRGDAGAFAQIYHRYAGLVRGTLLAHMPHQEVPDAVQEVFVSAWRKLAGLRNHDALGGWLGVIARNTARQYFRATAARVAAARRAAPAVAQDHPTDAQQAGVAASVSPAALEVLDALRSLPEAYRETMVLRFVEGMTGPEIAARTGLTAGSVRVNLHRGVQLLRARLGTGTEER